MTKPVSRVAESPKCPRCGYVMCEQFDTIKEVTLPYLTREYVQPNGNYICYHCEYVLRETKGKKV